jgi:hypothetical protein
MKKILYFLATFIVVATNVCAQKVLHSAQYQRVARINTQEETSASEAQTARTAPNATIPAYSTSSITSTLIGQSSNTAGYLLNSQRQLSTVNSVGTNGGSVGFIFRQRWQTCGSATVESGILRYNMTNDGGQTWFGTQGNCLGQGALQIDYTFPARYPNVYFFSEGGTTVNDLNLAYVAPVISTANVWSGAVLGTANDLGNTTQPTVNQEDYVSSTTAGIYRPINIAERVAGEFWTAVVTDANDIEIRKGNWDANAKTIAWNIVQTFNLDASLAINGDGLKYLGEGSISFSADGKSGYLVMSGDMIGGWDNCLNPIISEFNLNTGLFDTPYELSFNDIPNIPANIMQWTDSLNQPLATSGTMTNFTITVDVRGNLHIHALICPASSDAGHLYASFGTDLYDLTKDANGNWGAIHTAVISNPKNVFGPTASQTTYFTFANITRSPDGKFIIYSWEDTDTTGMTTITTNSDLMGRIYDVLGNKISPIKNWTGTDAVWAGFADMPKTSEVALEPSACTFRVPTTIMSIDNQSMADYYYFSDIEYNCADATDTIEWTNSPLAVNPPANPLYFGLSPNPASEIATLNLSFDKLENVTFSLVNLHGQILFEKKMPDVLSINEQIKVKDLPKGMYYVRISTNTATSSRKLVVE